MQSFENADDIYIKQYIAQLNTAYNEKCLEVISNKARIDVLNTQITELAVRVKDLENDLGPIEAPDESKSKKK